MATSARPWWQVGILVLAGTLLLCTLGFYNGFPLLYPDTGTYLESGFLGKLPIDRPIFYGLFLRHASLAELPLLATFVQSSMLAWLLWRCLGLWVQPRRLPAYYLGSLLLLVSCTGLPFVANILLPDIFTPILLLSGFLLALWTPLRRAERVAAALLFVLAILVHGSHLPVLALALPVLAGLAWWRRKSGGQPFHRWGLATLAGATLLCLLFIPGYHYRKEGHFRLSPGGQVFMTNRLRDLDILQDYLQASCPTTQWRLCPYRDSLYGDFLWDHVNSPLHKTGGWAANVEEYGRMNAAILSQPRYLGRYLVASMAETLRQLFVYEAGPVSPLSPTGAACTNVRFYFPRSVRNMEASLQARGLLDLDGLNGRQHWLVLGSMALLLLLALDRRRWQALPAQLRWLGTTLVLVSVANAFVCVSLSIVDPRFHGRLAWLFVFWAAVVGMHYADLRWPPRADAGTVGENEPV